MSLDPYKILDVPRNASDEDIKKAYRKKALEHHPDRGGNEEKFKELSEAYDILSNSEKKARYDRFGSVEGPGPGFNPSDIFGDIFGDMFGRRPQQQRKGQDIRVSVSLSIMDIINGSRKRIKYNRLKKCGDCSGKGGSSTEACHFCGGSGQKTTIVNTPFGRIQQSVVCPNCQGAGEQIKDRCRKCSASGVLQFEELLEVDIPKGALEGMQMTMHGMGNAILRGSDGDLHLLIREEPHPLFKRDGHNILVDKWVEIHEAVLGQRVQVQTPDETLEIFIPAGTEWGKTFTYQGKGIPILQNDGSNRTRGELKISIKIKIPKNISQEQKELFQKLKQIS
jgi:molecular chaperone DnaJ